MNPQPSLSQPSTLDASRGLNTGLSADALAQIYRQQPKPVFLVLGVVTLLAGLAAMIAWQVFKPQDTTWNRDTSAMSRGKGAGPAYFPITYPPSNAPYVAEPRTGEFPPEMGPGEILENLRKLRDAAANDPKLKDDPFNGKSGWEFSVPPGTELVGAPKDIAERYFQNGVQQQMIRRYTFVTRKEMALKVQVLPEELERMTPEQRENSAKAVPAEYLYYMVSPLDKFGKPQPEKLLELEFLFNEELKQSALTAVNEVSGTDPLWEVARTVMSQGADK